MYGLRYFIEYQSLLGHTSRVEIHQRDYTGTATEVIGGATPFVLDRKGSDTELFEVHKGTQARITLLAHSDGQYQDLLQSDERTYKVVWKQDGAIKWQGFILPDVYNEAYAPAPYEVHLTATDGLGTLKDLPLSDHSGTNFAGKVSEKNILVGALAKTGLGLNIRIGINIYAAGMEAMPFSCPLSQTLNNSEAYYEEKDGEIMPVSCMEAIEKILRSWNAVVFQANNEWWVVRPTEMLGTLYSRLWSPSGQFLDTGAFDPKRGFQNENISLHGAVLKSDRGYKNVTLSHDYGDLLVDEGNFVKNGFFENWTPFTSDFFEILGWRLSDWTYVNLDVWRRSSTEPSGYIGNVIRLEDVISREESKNRMGIYGVVRAFTDPIGYLESTPQPIVKELGNVINVSFKVAAGTAGTDKRLVEAYFVIALRCGSKWLGVDEEDKFVWKDNHELVRWKVATVDAVESISIEDLEVPEDGDVVIRLHQMVQVGSTARVEYVSVWEDVVVELTKNEALLNQKVYYKGTSSADYSLSRDEEEIQLGDALTIMSVGAKIHNNSVTATWNRRGVAEQRPLLEILTDDHLKVYGKTSHRLQGGTFKGNVSPNFLYRDQLTAPNRFYFLSGGKYDDKQGRWSSVDFLEVSTSGEGTIRPVYIARGRQGAGGSGRSTTSGSIGGENYELPMFLNGALVESGLRALHNDGSVFAYQFDKKVYAENFIFSGTDPEEGNPGTGGSAAIWGLISGNLADQTDLKNALDGKANTSHTHTIAQITGLQNALNGKANTNHTHTPDQVGLEEMEPLSIADYSVGDYYFSHGMMLDYFARAEADGATIVDTDFLNTFYAPGGIVVDRMEVNEWGQLTEVKLRYLRPQDIPVLSMTGITGLKAALDNKVSKWETWDADLILTPGHKAFADNFIFSGLDPEHGGTNPGGSAAVWGLVSGNLQDQTDLWNALNGKANTSHTHTIAQVSGLQDALDGKQASGNYEPAFAKNTGFNRNFGTAANTVAQGNDSRFHAALTLGTAQNGLALSGQQLTLALVTTSANGAMSSGDKTKLNGIEANAQVNVGTNLAMGGSGNGRTITSSTGSNVSVPVVTTSNAGFMATGDKTKLDGIEANAINQSSADARYVRLGNVNQTVQGTKTFSNAVYAPNFIFG